MAREFVVLERRPSPTGKDRVDDPKGKHDDYANALALAAAIGARGSIGMSQAGQVIVLEKKTTPVAVVMERLRQQGREWPVQQETFTDPRGLPADALRRECVMRTRRDERRRGVSAPATSGRIGP